MAQIKRKKVSTAKVANQKKNLFKNKLFWIISCIALVLITAGIVIPIVVINYNNSNVEHKDYFGIENTYNDNKINFTKANYDSIIMHTSELDFEDKEGFKTYKMHVFFFAFNLDEFYPDTTMDTDDNKLYNITHKEALERMQILQYEINKYNEKLLNDDDKDNDDEVAVLYVVDLSKAANSNLVQSTYSSYFGGTGEESFVFGYIAGVDKLVKSYKQKDKEYNIFTTDMNTFNTTVCNNAVEFMNTYNFKSED